MVAAEVAEVAEVAVEVVACQACSVSRVPTKSLELPVACPLETYRHIRPSLEDRQIALAMLYPALLVFSPSIQAIASLKACRVQISGCCQDSLDESIAIALGHP